MPQERVPHSGKSRRKARFFGPVATGLMTWPLLAVSPATASEAEAAFLGAAEIIDYRLPEDLAAADPSAGVAIDGQAAGETEAGSDNHIAENLPTIASRSPAYAYGPQESETRSDDAQQLRYRSFGGQVGAIKWELAAVAAYYTAINGTKLWENPTSPHFHSEGWFGKSTPDVGVDKLAHAYSAYVVSELFYGRLKHKTGNAPGIQYTAAALATGVMLYTEFWDSIERTAGWSWEDVAFNTLGAGFSILRNSVPGLDKKLDFRLMIVPNSDIVTFEGKRHFEQQRFFLALKLSGFDTFKKGPLRFLELHAGYYGKDFTREGRAAGIPPKRRVFVGFGINLRELFFKNSTGRVGRAAGEVLDYFQPPYTAIHTHLTN